ncbi:MAG: ATP synthase F1 subunit epsilon [Spirochaetes bacterium RBG_16_49_21]|nr:MAG: ATP synthase F1 subunit epsilon [Spirochaetes bacterium RBG_16_49_21]
MKKIACTILTPERNLFDGEIAFAVVDAHNGEMGFLVDHAPLISELGVGEVRLSDGKSTEYFVVEGGIVEIRTNKMIILAEKASKKEELDKRELEIQLHELLELKEKEYKAFSLEWMQLVDQEHRLKARIKVAGR